MTECYECSRLAELVAQNTAMRAKPGTTATSITKTARWDHARRNHERNQGNLRHAGEIGAK